MNRYGRTAIDRASSAIIDAACGQQEATLHRECYSIGGLVAAGLIDEQDAVTMLIAAARRMRTYKDRWTCLERKVQASVRHGMERPRRLANVGRNRHEKPRSPLPSPPDRPRTTASDALAIWSTTTTPRDTLVEAYLANRRLILDEDSANHVLRWHPRPGQTLGWRLPGAMVALYRNILTNAPQAVSLTLLDANARKIKRLFIGPAGGAVVKLDHDDCVTHGLYVGEGVETCMTARQWDLRPVWALGSAGAIAAFPVLAGVECLTILAENDCLVDLKNAVILDVEATTVVRHVAGIRAERRLMRLNRRGRRERGEKYSEANPPPAGAPDARRLIGAP
jgi:hypothetical protein